MLEALTDVYDMMSGNDNYKKKLRKRHEEQGLLKSAEGTTAQIMQRRHEAQEEEELRRLYQTRVAVEPKHQKKMY